jgi:hypothetical protein
MEQNTAAISQSRFCTAHRTERSELRVERRAGDRGRDLTTLVIPAESSLDPFLLEEAQCHLGG